MIRDISDICLQDTQNHVHTFTSKYRRGSPPKEPLEEPIRDSWLRRPGPPSGRFPFSRSSSWVHTWAAESEWTPSISVSAPRWARKHSHGGGYASAHHDGRGKALTQWWLRVVFCCEVSQRLAELRLGGHLRPDDVQSRTGDKPLDLLRAERVCCFKLVG
jgi:hypothetical protein